MDPKEEEPSGGSNCSGRRWYCQLGPHCKCSLRRDKPGFCLSSTRALEKPKWGSKHMHRNCNVLCPTSTFHKPMYRSFLQSRHYYLFVVVIFAASLPFNFWFCMYCFIVFKYSIFLSHIYHSCYFILSGFAVILGSLSFSNIIQLFSHIFPKILHGFFYSFHFSLSVGIYCDAGVELRM